MFDPRFGLNTSFNLPTGEDDRLRDPSAGARRFCERLFDADDSEAARLSVESGKGSPSSWDI